MVAESAQDSPSPIAPLLIWQQPHIIYMLHMAYLENRNLEFAEKYYILVKETADFMADYAVKNKDGVYAAAAAADTCAGMPSAKGYSQSGV